MSEEKILKDVYNKFGPRIWRWVDNYNQNPHLTKTTLNLPNNDVDIIEIFVKYGFYKDRSETMRYYIKEGIKNDLKLIEKLKKFKDYGTNTLGLILTKERIEKIKQIRSLDIKILDPLQEGSIQETDIIKKLKIEEHK